MDKLKIGFLSGLGKREKGEVPARSRRCAKKRRKGESLGSTEKKPGVRAFKKEKGKGKDRTERFNLPPVRK